MKLQINEAGQAVVQDGKPVYVADDGKTVVFDYASTLATISRLNGEAKSHRERAEAAETRAKMFEGIEDPEAARKALGVIKNLDDKKLVDAGEVDRIKAEAIKAVEDKYRPVLKERDTLKSDLYNERIGGSFSRSKFITDKLVVPADLVQAAFGNRFNIEDGKLVATDATGNRIFSRERPGELANFDEALETLVSQYPHRDSILKGAVLPGGSAQSGGSGAGGKRTLTRQQFEDLGPAAKIEAVKTSVIVD